MRLYLALAGAGLGVVVAGVVIGAFPAAALLALAAAPLVFASARCAFATHSTPRLFLPAMRAMDVAYLVATSLFTLAVLAGR